MGSARFKPHRRRSIDAEQVAAVAEHLGRCPDCGSTQSLEQVDESGVFVLTVHHDPTCPRLAAIEDGAR